MKSEVCDRDVQPRERFPAALRACWAAAVGAAENRLITSQLHWKARGREVNRMYVNEHSHIIYTARCKAAVCDHGAAEAGIRRTFYAMSVDLPAAGREL